jgi:hypothetical protein
MASDPQPRGKGGSRIVRSRPFLGIGLCTVAVGIARLFLAAAWLAFTLIALGAIACLIWMVFPYLQRGQKSSA